MATIESAQGEPLAILSHNQPVFYCIPPNVYQEMIDALEDRHFAQIVKQRAGEQEVPVDFDDL